MVIISRGTVAVVNFNRLHGYGPIRHQPTKNPTNNSWATVRGGVKRGPLRPYLRWFVIESSLIVLHHHDSPLPQ